MKGKEGRKGKRKGGWRELVLSIFLTQVQFCVLQGGPPASNAFPWESTASLCRGRFEGGAGGMLGDVCVHCTRVSPPRENLPCPHGSKVPLGSEQEASKNRCRQDARNLPSEDGAAFHLPSSSALWLLPAVLGASCPLPHWAAPRLPLWSRRAAHVVPESSEAMGCRTWVTKADSLIAMAFPLCAACFLLSLGDSSRTLVTRAGWKVPSGQPPSDHQPCWHWPVLETDSRG